MTQAVAHILEEAARLSVAEKAELMDGMVVTMGRAISSEIEQAQFDEVRRRIAQAESGEVALIPGEVALGQIRRLVASARN